MKNGRMANKKILKWVASGVMLALLFAMVFAGTLSGAFGVEEGLKNSGVIENSVADAAHTDGFNGTIITTGDKKTTLLYDSNKGLYYGSQYLCSSISEFTNVQSSGYSYQQYFTDGSSGENGARIYANNTVYLGWYVDFNGSLFYAIKNGAISKIDFKVNTTSPYRQDTRELKIRKYNQGDDAIKTSGTTTDTNKDQSASLSTTELQSALFNNSSYRFFIELGLSPKGALDVYFHSAWVDIYKSDTTAPTIAYDPATKKFEFNDATAGIYKVYKNGTDVTSSITDMSADTKSCSYTCGSNDSGNVTFKVVDNVGNEVETTYYLFKGTGSSSDPFLLRNRTDFDGLSTCVSNGITFSGKNFKVEPASGTTIDMGSNTFTPIGTNEKPFSGIIDGDGKTVSNLKVEVTTYAGLFGYTSGATLTDIKVSGYSYASSRAAGLLVGWMEGGKINGTTEAKLVAKADSDGVYGTFAGGLVGVNAGGTIEGSVTVSGDEVDKESGGYYMMGGVVGYNTGTISATITCSVRVIVRLSGEFSFSDSNKVTGAFAGGIVGCNNGGTLSGTFTKTGGDVIAPSKDDYVGGIVGYNNNGTMSGTFKQQANSATYDSSNIYGGQYVGGIVGFTTGVTLNGATSAGIVKGTGSQAVGGIVGGIASGASIEIKNCTNTGSVTAGDANGVAGIIGHSVSATNTIKVNGCINTGAIYGKVNTGGIGGRMETTSTSGKLTFNNCYNSGAISTSSGNTVGGIVGYLYANADASSIATITYCFNSGSVVSGDSGKSQGAIVGNPAGGTARVAISYCYTTQDMSISGTSGAATINANNYVIVSSTSNTSVTNGGSLLVYNGLKVVPAVGDTTYKDASGNADWTKITANNINALVVIGKLSNGKYMWIAGNAGGTASATVSGVSGAKTPIAQNTNTRDNDDTSAITGDLSCRFNADSKQNVYVKLADINMEIVNKTYSGSGQQCYSSTWSSGLPSGTSFQNAYYIHGNATDKAWYSRTDYSASGYDVITDIKINVNGVAKVIGRYVSNDDNKIWYIEKATLTLTPTWTANASGSGNKRTFIYNAGNQGLSAFEFSGFKTNSSGNTASDLKITYESANAKYTASDYKYTLDGSSVVKDVGSYSVTIKVTSNNYTVSGMTSGSVTYSWDIKQKQLTVLPTWVGTNPTESNGKKIYTYNATQQGVQYIAFSGFEGGQNLSSFGGTVTINSNYTKNNDTQYKWANTTCYKNKGDYTVTVTISSSNYYIDSTTYSWKINQFNLAASGNAVIGGNSNLKIGNTQEKFFEGNSYLELNNALIYTADSSYKAENFVVYVKYNNGISVALNLSSEYTLSELTPATGAPIDVTLSATGKDNFTGTVSATYTAMISDFGGNYNQANWGDIDNKFIISHPAHLIRLSEIVNGGKAWNSIYTDDTSLCLTKKADSKVYSKITSRTYRNAYFEVSANIDLTKYFNSTNGNSFTPIGNNLSHPFSGTFDGANTSWHINLYVNTSANYAGLFGFVQGGYKANVESSVVSIGASIKNVTVYGSVKGGNYVGGIVGHASFVPIENCNNYASVEGNSYVGGIAGMGGNTVGPSGKGEYGWGFTASKLSNNGTVKGSGDFVGGIIGYARDITFRETISNASGATISGLSYTGGITGRLSGGILPSATNGANVNGASYVGGLVGEINWGKVSGGTNLGTVIGSGDYVGGIAGALDKSDDTDGADITGTLTNTGCVSGVKYVGGIIGSISYTDKALANSNDTFNWTATVNITTGTLTTEADDGVVGQQYVGGAIGYLSKGVTINGTFTVKDKDIESNGFTSGVQYLGGIVGKNEGTITGSGTVSARVIGRYNGSYLGGIVGDNTGTISGTFTKSSGDVISVGIGGIYVGGIAGSSTGIITGTFTHTPTNKSYSNGNIVGGTYVGGLFGWLDLSSVNQDVNISINDSSNTSAYLQLSLTNGTPVEGKNCVGYLFGALIGNGYHESAAATIGTTLKIGNQFEGAVNGVNGGAVLGGLVGFMSKSAMMFTTDWNTSKITFGSLTNVSFVGGLVGMLGENGTIESDVTYDSNGTYVTGGVHTINAKATFGSASNRLGNFVGGIVGYVTSSAGVYYGTNANVLGNTMAFVNTGSIYGGSYVGGIYGAVGDFDESTATSLSSGYDISSYLVKLLNTGNFAGVRSRNTLTINPNATDNWHNPAAGNGGKMTNAANHVLGSGNYVGGLIGFVGANTTITFENDEATFKGNGDITKLSIYSGNGYHRIIGKDYVGGLIGYLSDGAHSFKYVAFRGYMGSGLSSNGTINDENTTSTYVGGLVGYMAGGTMEGCVAVYPDAQITSATQVWKGADCVGGLVGFTVTGSFKNCYTAGFKLSDTTSTRGGLIGMGVLPTIEDCWTFYVADGGSTYSTVSNNTYGKYVAVDSNINLTSQLNYASFKDFVKDKTFAFKVKVPSNNQQLAFYNASGSDTVTSNTSAFTTFTQASNELAIGLNATSATSMQVYVVDIKFVNVAKDTSGQEKSQKTTVQNAYRHPSSSEQYDAEIVTAIFNTSGYVTQIGANIYFNPTGTGMVIIGTANMSNNYVGGYSQTLTPGSEATPITISNLTEWNAWASTANGPAQYVSLIGNVDATGQSITLATGFKGIFNGNGYWINIGTISASSNGTSLFPSANGATFKNLTIKGTINNTGEYSGTAGFVGIAAGNLTFENCTNQVTISSNGKNVGGILGQTHTAAATYTFTDCVNTANLTNTYTKNGTGMGGIIGNAITTSGAIDSISYGSNDSGTKLATITLESCRNAGNLTGTFNIGGIVGRNGGATTITNCGNSGNITGNGESSSQVNNMDTNVGGIGGLTTYNATINVYASYNSGDILGWGNKAGGILAADCEYEKSASRTQIYYCYNTGSVTTGGNVHGKEKIDPGLFSNNNTSNGCIAGGIAGGISNADIQYCYNTGKITTNGFAASYMQKTKARVGGIVGFIDGENINKTIAYCYNIGEIYVGGYTSGEEMGASPIVGGAGNDVDVTGDDSDIITSNNYSLNGLVKKNTSSGGNTPSSAVDYYAGDSGEYHYGNLLATIDLMTSFMNGGGNMTIAKFNSQSLSVLNDANGIKQTNGGYIYIQGCLPQLAVFAIDTQNGLAMTSVAYGVDQYGEYTLQSAGSESNPFIIKDGIDLLGLQALVNGYKPNSNSDYITYSFEGKYIEFANETNNLEATQTKEIEFPTYSNTATKYSGTGYQSKNGTTYTKGKSYHLFLLGAVCASDSTYQAWLDRNNYYDVTQITTNDKNEESGTYTNANKQGNYSNQNFNSIGKTLGTPFSGNISGKQADDSCTQIVNARINREYCGLFDVVSNGSVSYIELVDSRIQSVRVAGGIVARPRGSTVIDNCKISGSTTVKTYGHKDTYVCAVGGIAGYGYTYDDSKDNNGKVKGFTQGTSLTISNCVVDCTVNATNGTGLIVGYVKYVGGIIGTVLDANDAEGKNNKVVIEDCKVLGGSIQATQSTSANELGGIIGYSSYNSDSNKLSIIVGITGCEVGTGTGNVTISGKTNIGGIVGAMSFVQGGYVKDCKVGSNATIKATVDNASSIGGLVGSSDAGQGDNTTMTFQGTNSFGGTINLNNSKNASNVGGIIGTMNNGASFFTGSIIIVTGNITSAGQGTTNIGGVAGLTADVSFNGTFTVGPNMDTSIVDNVGGFIGKNTGATHILAENTVIDISGTIKGLQEVGGFIGVNNEGASLVIGDDVYKGKPYTGNITITVNATISAPTNDTSTESAGNNAGGIVGKNEGTVSIVKGTISTSKTSSVSGKDNVGGIVGLNDGDLSTGGSGTSIALSITNGGEVNGTNYVGGVFGKLNKGTISGEFTNSGSVTANGYFAGGVIGYLASGAQIGSADNKTAVKLTNGGSVTASSYAGGSIGYVAKGASIIANSNTSAKVEFVNSGSVSVTNYFAGGSIGILYGSIKATASNRVLFSVAGENASIAGKSYLGGSIGVIAGKIDCAQFTNSANLTINDGETAIGGSVGFVGKPASSYVSAIQNISNVDECYGSVASGDIVISNSHFESTGSLTVNTTSSQAESGEVETTNSGGVGGAIGVIGGSDNMFSNDNWTKNTYYAMANVIAPSANNVGGVFGLVRADGFEISNMLAYQTTVQGKHNVGGIVGAITGSEVKISSSFALEGKFSGASNVGGIVGLANDTTDASTAYWMLGLNNSTLASSNVNELSTKLGFNGSGNSLTYAIKAENDAKIYTTGHGNTGWFFLYANDADGNDGIGKINVIHNSGNNLDYWKRIANAYSADERAQHDDTKTLNNSALTADNSVAKGYVYATATAAPIANGGTGFYLYTQTSQEGTNPNITHYTTDNKDAFYININTSQNVGNFVVYYRMITSGNALTYNGYQRIGVVGMDGVTIFTGDNINNHVFEENEREKYYFTTATTGTTEGGQTTTTTPMTNAGMYSSNINIYYVDKGGNVYNVGGNSAMTWTINKRDLSIVLNDGNQVNNRWYGQEWQKDGSISYDMKFVISNIAPGQYNKEVCTITVNKFIFTIKINENGTEASVTYSGDNKGVLLNATVTTATTENPEDKTYIADGVDTSNGYYAKILTCYLAFTIAKSYDVTIDVSTNGTVQNYTLPQSEYKFGVNERTLTVTPTSWTTGQTSTSPYAYVYNTKFQGLQTIGLDSGTSNGTTGLVNEDKVTLKVTVTLNTGKETFTVSDTTEAFGATDNANIVDIIKKIAKYGFVGTYTVKYEVGADGGGKYSITTDSNGNSDTWKITQYEVKFNGFSNMGTEKTYDATAVVPILNISSEGITNDNGTYTYGDDTFTLTYKINNSSSAEKLVNAGTYNITIGSSNGSINASRKGNNDIGNTSENYKFSGTTSTTTYTIHPRSVALTWETTSSFVYSASAQGLKVTGASQDETFTYSVNNATLTSATLSVKKGGTIVDKITLKYSGSQTNVCNGKHMSYGSHSVDTTYKHDGIQTDKGNYTINNTSSGNYSIVPSNIKISGASVSGVNKVYDGNTNVTNGKISWSITHGSNNGHIPTNSEDENSYAYFKLTSKAFVSKDVGNNIGISVAISFVSSNNNYTGSNYSATIYGGTITPKPIMVVLNGLRNGKATKVYDGDATYAGSISGNGTAGSRLGERFTVDRLLDSNVTISANYVEADEKRSEFNSYVNGVFKNADNTYSQVANTYYKKLVFTMSGDGANNYMFNVYDTSNNAYGKEDGVGKDSTVTVYDSADMANKDNCGVAGGITIEITINSVRVNYSNTYQSYVDENGSYKEKWDRVAGTISGASTSDVVKVHNYWMYEDGIDDELDEGYKRYTGYTVIKGSKNSKLLYAEVNPTNGMQYNYRLSNQPTLTIAYIVSDSGAFEIDSMADLLIASFYYSASQNSTAPEFVQIVKSGYEWVELVSNEAYEQDMAKWDAEFEKYEGVFLNETSTDDNMKTGWWGYYKATEDSSDKTIPSSFKLTKDIYGMLTSDDITKLKAFFTVAKSDDNGDITQTSYTWGAAGTYLKNLLTTKEGSVVTLLGSLFVTDSGKDGFGGTFDGNGYVIEYLNIMGYNDYDNVGLFDVIGAGTIEDLHLRNISINANKGNVGGIAGQIKAGESAVSNVSFHGSINASGATNVGGLFGKSERAISNAIVLGTINSNNSSANVGGVVGYSSASISYVVSMMQITANSSNTGAFVGTGTNANASDSYHMQNAVYNGKSFVNESNAKTYSELMAGSTSGYGDNGKYSIGSSGDSKGDYDVLEDKVNLNAENPDNARQSMRLRDIVSVYLLMYSLAEDTSNKIYSISSDSWLVGDKLGTTDSPIIIANKQNVSLLRELRFATFELKANVDVTISSTFSGTFYGTVIAGDYKITCNKDMFSVYLNDKTTWLQVSANS